MLILAQMYAGLRRPALILSFSQGEKRNAWSAGQAMACGLLLLDYGLRSSLWEEARWRASPPEQPSLAPRPSPHSIFLPEGETSRSHCESANGVKSVKDLVPGLQGDPGHQGRERSRPYLLWVVKWGKACLEILVKPAFVQLLA